MCLKVGPLQLRLDALGDYDMLEALSHVNDGAHDCGVIGIGSDLAYKGAVNFEDVNGELPKIAHAGIADAEVIDRKMYPHHFELSKNSRRRFRILHKDTFGELEFEIASFQPSFREYSPDVFDKPPVAELDGGNIDGNRQWR